MPEFVIVGFHRSGTSLLSQLLHRAGLFLGDELLGALPSNPYGHFEDVEIVNIHESILHAHGESWQVDSVRPFLIGPSHWERMRHLVQRRRATHRQWGFKDPRVCFFLGAWRYLMPDAKVVVVYRDPAECVSSLEHRQANALFQGEGSEYLHRRFWKRADHGMRMWTAHNRAILDFVDEHPDDCLVVPFTDLARGVPVVRAINQRFGADLVEVPTTAVFDPAATSARPGPQWVFSPDLADEATTVWNQLEHLAAPLRTR